MILKIIKKMVKKNVLSLLFLITILTFSYFFGLEMVKKSSSPSFDFKAFIGFFILGIMSSGAILSAIYTIAWFIKVYLINGEGR